MISKVGVVSSLDLMSFYLPSNAKKFDHADEKLFRVEIEIVIYMLLDRTRFRARVEAAASDHNRMIPIVFSRLVLTKSWKFIGEVVFMKCS